MLSDIALRAPWKVIPSSLTWVSMWLPAVVKPRSDVHSEGHLTTHTPEHADQLMPVGGDRGAGDRHEIDDFAHTRLGQKTGDEDGGVRVVELLPGEGVDRGPGAQMSAAIIVQQRSRRY